jgi:mono/diheme cytochrome c family protein
MTVRSCHIAGGILLPILIVGLCGCPIALRTPVRERIHQPDIDSGYYDVYDLKTHGRALYIHNFGVEDGFGNGRGGATPPNFSRLVGPDATSCNSCHGLGGIIAGWGTNAANLLVELDDPVNPTVTGSNERNTPHEQGVGWLELLSKEMSLDLRKILQQAEVIAIISGEPATLALMTKGVEFGEITAFPDGTLDTSGVVGCDPDLRVRPLHAKGHESTVRIFTRSALARHPGIQSSDILLHMDNTRDPALWDEDEDGVYDEMNEGEVTAMIVFQVTLPAPVETETGEADVERGRALMDSLGCTECHRPNLHVADPVWRYTSSYGGEIAVDLTDLSLGAPRLLREDNLQVLVPLWGDLKRHDLGPESHEPLDQPVDDTLPNWDGGTPGDHIAETVPPIHRDYMLTTELWGVGDTAPYWHDGSSPTIDDAIRRHGGEAQASRDAYVASSTAGRTDLLAFLQQLRVGVVGEILVTGNKESVDPRNLPLNSVTQDWVVEP